MLGAYERSNEGDEIEYIQYCQWVRYLRVNSSSFGRNGGFVRTYPSVNGGHKMCSVAA